MTANTGNTVFVEIAVAAVERREDTVRIELHAIEIGGYQLKDEGHHVALMRNGAAEHLAMKMVVVGTMISEFGVSLTDIVPVASGNTIHGGNNP